MKTVESTHAIRSTQANIEQLVIDGSDAEHVRVNQEFCSSQANVRYLRREAMGISDAFNYGISSTRYEWLWCLNGGDQLCPSLELDVFCRILRTINADIVIFQMQRMQSGVVIPFPPPHQCFPPVIPWIPHPASIIRKDIFSRYGLFDPRYQIAMDYELWLRLYGQGVVVNLISLPVAVYDEYGISSTAIAKVSSEGMNILRENKGNLFKLWLRAGKNMISQYRKFRMRACNEN